MHARKPLRVISLLRDCLPVTEMKTIERVRKERAKVEGFTGHELSFGTQPTNPY